MPRVVPVTMGSPRFHTLESGGLRVTEAWFPPRELLHPHVHDRAVFAVMLEGSFELRFGGHGAAAVCCPYRIEPRQLVRCELRYSDGIARAMLVRLTPDGELEAVVPYPATLRR